MCSDIPVNPKPSYCWDIPNQVKKVRVRVTEQDEEGNIPDLPGYWAEGVTATPPRKRSSFEKTQFEYNGRRE